MLREYWSKLCRTLAGRRGLAGDLDAEIHAHLEFEIQENIARGMPPDEARAAARRHVGNLTQIQEGAVDAWSFPRWKASRKTCATGCGASGGPPVFRWSWL